MLAEALVVKARMAREIVPFRRIGTTVTFLVTAMAIACASDGDGDAQAPLGGEDTGTGFPFPTPDAGGDGMGPCADGAQRACSTDACPVGTQTCTAGAWGQCHGPAEVCDGVDNDCDGTTDEDVIAPPCDRVVGACAGTIKACGGAAGWLACDDIQYGAQSEQYVADEGADHCDGIDNDCDGRTDEGDCTCTPGASQLCGNSVGECAQGIQNCVDGGWGPCENEVTPTDEQCNGRDDNCDGQIDEGLEAMGPDCPLSNGVCAGARSQCFGANGWGECGIAEYGDEWRADEGGDACDGLDNDCDGTVDELDCACQDGATQACGSDVGACEIGQQTCTTGGWGECDGAVNPVAESCNGLDDDCDGAMDEGLESPACALTEGVCVGAVKNCGGADGWLACAAETYVAVSDAYVDVETDAHCDGLDNDCDGLTDEECECVAGTTQVCGSNVGACTQGQQTCNDGLWSECDGVGATGEICDGLDNDCDGQVDEEIESPVCPLDVGVCAGATQRCVGGQFAPCGVAEYGPRYDAANELRCDGFDNDCDGQTDEDCNCVDGESQACGTNEGACEAGQQTCVLGRWRECRGATVPVDEICNGIDDDCDGETDAQDEQIEAPICQRTQGVCRGAVQTCGGESGWIACDDARYVDHNPAYVPNETAEHCDGLDNDCDGVDDEECECVDGDQQVCGTSAGICTQGTRTCVGGRYNECDGVAPSAETCNGLDDDCDGTVDEDLATPLCSRQEGVCANARRRCVDGQIRDCDSVEYGALYDDGAELRCDGFDNNCDGEIDEGCQCRDGEIQACGSELGECAPGSQTCVHGAWSICEDAVEPVFETCDGKDNDCDGNVDEDVVGPACALAVGVCAGATETCMGPDGFPGSCSASEYGERYRADEGDMDCDGFDNDCDGQIDEACECQPGAEQPVCGTHTGECAAGRLECVNGSFGACIGEIPPVAEVCDGLDNDCDGPLDEELEPPPCELQAGICAGAIAICGGGDGWLECDEEQYGFDYRIDETNAHCDGLDNDCDGLVDENCPLPEVKINELFVNPQGADGPLTFIELRGTPGLFLNGMSLEAVGGTNGRVYETIHLDDLQIGAEGYVLIAELGTDNTPGAIPVLADLADLVVRGADLQNGPDSVRLVRDNGEVVDAVGYLTEEGELFPNPEFNAGEGAPAIAPSGFSITRDADGTDTDDNATDFATTQVPTPGGTRAQPRIHVRLLWSTDGTDYDLHFLQGGSEWSNSPGDVYFGNRSPDWGVLGDPNDNPTLARDDTDGFGPEYTDHWAPQPDNYLVAVDYYRGDDELQSVATVEIYLDGVLELTLTRQVSTEERYWSVATIFVDDNGGMGVEPRDVVSATEIDNPL